MGRGHRTIPENSARFSIPFFEKAVTGVGDVLHGDSGFLMMIFMIRIDMEFLRKDERCQYQDVPIANHPCDRHNE
jgi:hypothetical protein